MERNVMGELNVYRGSGAKPNFSEIARRHGMDRHTVAKYWREGESAADGRSARGSAFDPFEEVIRAKAQLPGMTIFVGSPGVGKTHLAVALGIEAVRAGREVRFVDCARLVEDLEDASSRGILKKRLKYYAHSRLLIIDELGYLDVGSAGADLLFQLISTRYEQRSTIITTNVGISGWGRVFGDDVAASAIADRVCHHCHLVKITGRSYRLKDLPRDGPVKP